MSTRECSTCTQDTLTKHGLVARRAWSRRLNHRISSFLAQEYRAQTTHLWATGTAVFARYTAGISKIYDEHMRQVRTTVNFEVEPQA